MYTGSILNRRDKRLQTLLEALRRQLDTSFLSGERLPAERRLASTYGVGATTIHRALQTLAGEGRLTATPRSGWIKKEAQTPALSPRRHFSVGLISRRSDDEWQDQPIYSALSAEAKTRSVELIPVPNPHYYHNTTERVRIDFARVPWNSFDVGLLVEAEDTIRLRDQTLDARRVLAVDYNATRYGLDSVSFADWQAGEDAAKYLLNLGHLRIAVTEQITDPGLAADPASTLRRLGAEAALAEAGACILPQWRMPVHCRGGRDHSHPGSVAAIVANWAKAPPKQRPTALLAFDTTPITHGGLFRALNTNGLNVPRDLSIIGICWSGHDQCGGPETEGLRLTRLEFDLSALVRRTFDAAAALAAEEWTAGVRRERSPQLYLAPVMLTPGQSTCAPPDAGPK
jgi:DNA-binding LacI/PurR family transcriptional regulator